MRRLEAPPGPLRLLDRAPPWGASATVGVRAPRLLANAEFQRGRATSQRGFSELHRCMLSREILEAAHSTSSN